MKSQADAQPMGDCYQAIGGGFEIRLTGDPAVAGSQAGDNPRLHRRPLYPPADKSLLWNEAERETLARLGFRPPVPAYNAPRFLLYVG